MQRVKSWIGANEIIARDREYEIYAELNSGINLKYKEFIRKREAALAATEERLARQRAKLRAAEERKRAALNAAELEPERSV